MGSRFEPRGACTDILECRRPKWGALRSSRDGQGRATVEGDETQEARRCLDLTRIVARDAHTAGGRRAASLGPSPSRWRATPEQEPAELTQAVVARRILERWSVVVDRTVVASQDTR
jgi:hypothetical protein